jgi:DNA invertase Pin-like site-specific DNA recombinase
MIIGYARVSTSEQNLDLQRDALKRAGCEKIIEDTVSGGKVQRPRLDRVHHALRYGDVLAVWRIEASGDHVQVRVFFRRPTRGLALRDGRR